MHRAPINLIRSAARRSLQSVRASKFQSSFTSSSFFGQIRQIHQRRWSHALAWRHIVSRAVRSPRAALPFFMRYHLSAGVFAALVAGGTWYYNATHDPIRADSGRHSPISSDPISQSSLSHSSASQLVHDATSTSTRKALIVEDGQIYSSVVSGPGPISKDINDSGNAVLEMLNPEQATQKLRQNEASWLVGRGRGVVRYDVVQIPSNSPIEDDHAEEIIQVPNTSAATADGVPNSDWMFWGVFDGHNGWITSAKLRQSLISYVTRELNKTYTSALQESASNIPTPDAIDDAMKAGFVRLDNEIVYDAVNKVDKAKSKRVAAEALAPAIAGSCALLSFFDSNSKTLRVACAGDSRAVLGRKSPNGKWKAIPLSADQTGSNEDEVNRIRAEHPNEPNVIKHGRVLGSLEPSRSFGDAMYKWSIDTLEELRQVYFVRSGSSRRQTPPYVTAEPVVTRTKIEPGSGDFVVMATDGLWEMLTNEQVIGLVAQWLEFNKLPARSKSNSYSASSWLGSWFLRQNSILVEMPTAEQFGKLPVRQQQWKVEDMASQFVYQDKNVATHIVRNALGGKNNDQLCALLTLISPFSRKFRDDLTVSVIFFGEESSTGNVTLNKEASASTKAPKARL